VLTSSGIVFCITKHRPYIGYESSTTPNTDNTHTNTDNTPNTPTPMSIQLISPNEYDQYIFEGILVVVAIIIINICICVLLQYQPYQTYNTYNTPDTHTNTPTINNNNNTINTSITNNNIEKRNKYKIFCDENDTKQCTLICSSRCIECNIISNGNSSSSSIGSYITNAVCTLYYTILMLFILSIIITLLYKIIKIFEYKTKWYNNNTNNNIYLPEVSEFNSISINKLINSKIIKKSMNFFNIKF